MSEWKEYKTTDLLEQGLLVIGDGYRAKNIELSASKFDGLPFARVGNINEGFNFHKADYFPNSNLKKVGEKISKVGDVVFTSKGTVGRFAFVNNKSPMFVYSPQLCFWRSLDQNFILPRFLLYWMQSREFFEQADAVKSQTDMADYVNLSDQRKMKITLPAINEQIAIASILSSLDNKIDLLHRQNATLEKMAETLFRQWFVEEAKEDWEVKKMDSLISIGSGKGLKKENFIDTGLYPILGANGEIGRTNKFLFNERLIYTGRVGTLGNIFRIENEKVWLSDNTLVIKPLEYFNFIYLRLKTSRLEDYNVGSTQPLIRQSDIKEIDVVLPSKEKLKEFESIADNIYKKILSNQTQIRTLTALRDSLLPKLMSGEVKVVL